MILLRFYYFYVQLIQFVFLLPVCWALRPKLCYVMTLGYFKEEWRANFKYAWTQFTFELPLFFLNYMGSKFIWDYRGK